MEIQLHLKKTYVHRERERKRDADESHLCKINVKHLIFYCYCTYYTYVVHKKENE